MGERMATRLRVGREPRARAVGGLDEGGEAFEEAVGDRGTHRVSRYNRSRPGEGAAAFPEHSERAPHRRG